jgi:hypothetical protein
LVLEVTVPMLVLMPPMQMLPVLPLALLNFKHDIIVVSPVISPVAAAAAA